MITPSGRRLVRRLARWAVSAVVLTFCSTTAFAQPAVSDAKQPDLAGSWSLNIDLSDHPERIAAALRADFGLSFGPERFDGRGRGPERGRRGDDTSPERDQPEAKKPSDESPEAAQLKTEEQQKREALTRAVQFPPTSMTLALTGDELTITSPVSTTNIVANGKGESVQLGGISVERTAALEGPELVIRYDLGKAGIFTYRYLVVPRTRQLLVRVTVEPIEGRSAPFDIKYVYDRTAG